MSRQRIIKFTVAILVGVLLFVFCYYQNKHLVISEYTYANSAFSEKISGYTIVQISDLHNAEFGQDNSKLIGMIADSKPDIIVITGDVVDSNHTDIECALEFVRAAIQIADVYYVTGNHENWLNKDEYATLTDGIREAGAVILDNDAVLIEDEFWLVGLDDGYLQGDTLKNVIADHNQKPNIVLAHEPQYLNRYAEAGADLVLSGHAHGGQFILPFIGAVIAPDQGFLPDITEGEHYSGNTTMIVSRGLGNSIVPVRLFNYPEIVIIRLDRLDKK